MPGVKLVHAPQVPAAIPVRPNTLYFALEKNDKLYNRMMKSQTASIYVPTGINDLKLNLMAVSS
jgi:type VI secretion system protein ImpJ